MKIIIGSDHAGFELKGKIKEYLDGLNFEYEDLGANSLDPSDDYPDFIIPVAKKVAKNPKENLGIVIGGSGQGEAIAANKIKGIRATVYYGGSLNIVKLSRTHNNSNILSLGARFLTEGEAIEAVKLWIETPFSNEERHKRRIGKIEGFENK
ncbi:MAG: RpiB/LacA/LacB family sugar-phosphate isomerase [Candidatus Aenigmarchaeota archaeon]|nr:RpiB/LacA/LacB family sugar-phosphate isomerase [Candidatus Aenigmarchaeota archaeon]